MNPIYLDYNATTPIDERVINAMRPYLEGYYGNPSSSHIYGIQSKKAIENARKQIAKLINCKPYEVIFTSGGTESNNYAIKGVAYANQNAGNHIITSSVEHPAVTEVCKYLTKKGFDISFVTVDKYGLVDPEEIQRAITAKTILITIMHANNEVGTIQPIKEIAEIARSQNIIFHTDAAQSIGKIPTDVEDLGVDLLSIAGHKLYGPKGIGALYIKEGTILEKLIHGADHEQDFRAGTENVLQIVGLGQACEIAGKDFVENMQHLHKMRDLLHTGLNNELTGLKLNGHPDKRLPNTLNISFPNIEADLLLSETKNVAASAGAACHSQDIEISSVLTAMKVPVSYAKGAIRFSTGRQTTEDEINQIINIISKAVRRLRGTNDIEIQKDKIDSSDIKLTQFTQGLGCACKMSPQVLEKVLKSIPVLKRSGILVGTETFDDAAVFQINENTAIVQTVDFFTPIVDSPFDYGAIATANALSDIYAMGAKPVFALNIVCFPSTRLPIEALEQILRGAAEKADEAGISVLGGHTIEDPEPKYGMVVTGIVHPKKIIRNSNAKPDDVIILTKPIGLGIISTAVKKGFAEVEIEHKAIKIMSELNKTASEIMIEFPVNACTDVTGFGLLGHLKEMTGSGNIGAEIGLDNVPVIPKTWEFATANMVPGGTLNNLNYVKDYVRWDKTISKVARIILCDAQTSGGLLIAVPGKFSQQLIKRLHEAGISEAAIIGKFTKQGNSYIIVTKSQN